MEIEHGPDVTGHGLRRRPGNALGVVGDALFPLFQGPALGQVAVDRVVGAGLVGDDIRTDAAAHQFGHDIGGVAEQADGHCVTRRAGFLDGRQSVVEIIDAAVEIAALQAPVDAARPALDGQHGRPGHRRRQGLGTAHAAETGG